jgi:secreted Zn-dependent insulinase-like peptidase
MKSSDLKGSWEENRVMSQLEFEYLEKSQPMEYATMLAHALAVYPPESVLTGQFF